MCLRERGRMYDKTDRLSNEAALRKGNSLKQAAKYLSKPGLISLGGGLPTDEYFPFSELHVRVPTVGNFSDAETQANGTTLVSGKHDLAAGTSLFDISTAFNYGQGTGAAQLLRWVVEHIELVHDPLYADWSCTLTVGSSSGLDMLLRMLARPGDVLLTEEYTFSTAVETARPMGIHVVGVAMDEQGLKPDTLDDMLLNWDARERRCRKPALLYTVPTGQNPTGATQDEQRRRWLYEVARKHDLLIIEDEPYYFLQMPPYGSPGDQQEQSFSSDINDYGVTPSSDADSIDYCSVTHHHILSDILPTLPITPDLNTNTNTNAKTTTTTAHRRQSFLSSLVPSLLHIDTDGRVLRLDSFSKVISPGLRVGFLTGPEQLISCYVRHADVSAQCPAGPSQLLLFKLLDEHWGHAGYFDWLMWLREQYTRRRDVILRACEEFLPREVCSWKPPMAGMFVSS